MRVIVVDDDRLVTSSLKTIIEADPIISVEGIGYNGLEAVDLFKQLQPDILLIDIRMEEMNGIDAARIILERYPEAKVLFLTTFSDDEYIIQALKIGAKGYLLKQNFESIIPSLKTVYAGQRVFGDEIITKIPSLLNDASSNPLSDLELSDKELLIITHVAEGLSNKEIADLVCLGEGTVRNYISIILDKLSLRDRTQLAVFYYKRYHK
ncbi:response regulator [Petrocella sp. FN5]|uniref:response regulator n=1 Tax=Petrocella sp. FN5 TaxID=3032002 RepID=UPI0023DAEDDE|nr:response regulator transcription factor [Petrocella sp. FN5]MDF1617153.1 response regulator transcription factor [Petrocella sp. FN5]